jgi:hypothetical protein
MKKLLVLFSVVLLGFAQGQSVKYGLTGSVHRVRLRVSMVWAKAAWGGSLGYLPILRS